MPSSNQWIAFLVASFLFIQVPGPSVLFMLSRALTVSLRDALISVVGNGLGVVTQVLLVALGLGAVVAASATAYTVLKVAGAGYVIYLGIHAIRHRSDARLALLEGGSPQPEGRGRALGTGFVVGVTNPKTIVFFVAFLPQFTSESAAAGPQLAGARARLRRHGGDVRQHLGDPGRQGPPVVRPQADPPGQARRGRRSDDDRTRHHHGGGGVSRG